MIKIIEQPLLTRGGLSIPDDKHPDYIIFIDSEQSEREKKVTYWHELVHLVLFEYGIDKNHNEEKIDQIAELLMNQIEEDKNETDRF